MKKTIIITLILFLGLALMSNNSEAVEVQYVKQVLLNETCEAWNGTQWTAWNLVVIPQAYYSWPSNTCRLSAGGGTPTHLDSNPTYTMIDQTNALNLSYTFFLASYGANYLPGLFNDNNGSFFIQMRADANRNLSLHIGDYNTGEIFVYDSEIGYNINYLIYDNCSIIVGINGTELAEVFNCSYKQYTYNISTETHGVGWSHINFDNLVLWQNYTYASNTQGNIFDETNDSLINWTTTSLNFVSDNYNYNLSTTNGSFDIDLAADSYEIRYRPNNYTERSYYLTVNNSEDINNITLYSLRNDTGYFPIVITVFDQYNEPVPGARVQALRYFLNDSTPYKLTAMRDTDQNGQAAFDLELYTAWYKFQVIHDNTIKVRDGPRQIFDTSWSYYLSTAEDYYGSYNSIGTLSYFLEFLNTTNQFRLEWADTDGFIERICLDVVKIDRVNEEGVCFNCSNSIAGVLYCDVTDDNQSTYLASMRIESDTEFSDYLDTISISFSRLREIFGINALFYGGMLFLATTIIGFLIAGIVGGLIFGLGGGIISIGLTGIIEFSWIAIGSIIILFIVIIILLARRRGE